MTEFIFVVIGSLFLSWVGPDKPPTSAPSSDKNMYALVQLLWLIVAGAWGYFWFKRWGVL